MRRSIEPADDLHLHAADRQVDREAAGNIGVGRRSQDQVATVVLVEARIDLVAMPDRRQVATVGGGEADAGRRPLAGRPVDDLHLDRDARWREHLDRSPAGRIAERATREQVGAGESPVTEAEDRVGRDRQVDHGRSRGRRIGMATRGSPAEDRVRRSLPGRRRDRRPAADDRAKIDLRVALEARHLDLEPTAPNERIGRATEERDRRDEDVAARPSVGQRLEAQGDRPRASLELDGVQPEERVAGRAGDEVRDPDLVRAVRAGHDRQRAGLAGRRIAARALRRVRPTPVDDLVRDVGDRGERPGSPAEDAVVHLESASDEAAGLPPVAVHERVPRKRLADGDDVPDGQARRAAPGVVAPGIAQVGDDDMARAVVGRQLHGRRPVEQDPAGIASSRPEVEWQAVEHLPPDRQALERRSVRGVETGVHVGSGRVPHGVEVDRPRQWAGRGHQARFRRRE